jgi:hypothetical protein
MSRASCVLCWVHNSKQVTPDVKQYFDQAAQPVAISVHSDACASPKYHPGAKRTQLRYRKGHWRQDFQLEGRMVDVGLRRRGSLPAAIGSRSRHRAQLGLLGIEPLRGMVECGLYGGHLGMIVGQRNLATDEVLGRLVSPGSAQPFHCVDSGTSQTADEG